MKHRFNNIIALPHCYMNYDTGIQTDIMHLILCCINPLYKLEWYGIQGGRIFSSFLDWRTQCVALDGVHLSKCTVLSGVPQGTVLGPIMFTICRNNLYTRKQKKKNNNTSLQNYLLMIAYCARLSEHLMMRSNYKKVVYCTKLVTKVVDEVECFKFFMSALKELYMQTCTKPHAAQVEQARVWHYYCVGICNKSKMVSK